MKKILTTNNFSTDLLKFPYSKRLDRSLRRLHNSCYPKVKINRRVPLIKQNYYTTINNDSTDTNKHKIKVNERFNSLLDNLNIESYKNKLGKKIVIEYSYNSILDFNSFINKIFNIIHPKVNYMLIMKIRYKGVHYLTLDNQERFYYEDYQSTKDLKQIYDFIIQRITQYSEEYQFN